MLCWERAGELLGGMCGQHGIAWRSVRVNEHCFPPQYETALEGEVAGSLQQMAYHTVNRRYREFLNLQTRLEEKPELRKFLKSQCCISFL